MTQHLTKIILLTLCLWQLFLWNVASAAEWQWSVPDGNGRAYLWIPPDCQRIRAVVVGQHNMLEQGILEHSDFRSEMQKLGIAEVWYVPKFEMQFDFNKGAGEHFQRIMDALAEASGYTELKVAPVVPIGHSACATYPWNFAAWNPGRTLAVLSFHGEAPRWYDALPVRQLKSHNVSQLRNGNTQCSNDATNSK